MVTHKANYTAYVRQFKERQKTVGKANMPDSELLSKKQFEDAYTFQYNTFQKQVERGARKAIGNVTRTIVSKQAYDTSYKQGRALLKAYRDYINEEGVHELQARAMSYAIERRAESGLGPFTESELTKLRKQYSNLSLKQIQTNTPEAIDYFNALKAIYHERKQETGESGTDAGEYISKTIIGSP